jgi:predicted N-acetyltransferase YhbS
MPRLFGGEFGVVVGGPRMDFDIRYLADEPSLVPQVALLLNQTWGNQKRWDSIPNITSDLNDRLNKHIVPLTYVALGSSKTVLGTISIELNELPQYPKFVHWIGELAVASSARCQGIGSALLRTCVEKARTLGIYRIYLSTPDQERFYRNREWSRVGRGFANDEPVVIMTRYLLAQKPSRVARDMFASPQRA